MTTVSGGGGMLRPEEESEAEVRREDQNNINQFARLNARLNEVKAEKESMKKQLEGIDDASTELMMGSGEQVMLMVGGETFFEVSEEYATEHCEAEVEKLQEQVDSLEQEEADILESQAKLKTILYGRFGKSIQLEA